MILLKVKRLLRVANNNQQKNHDLKKAIYFVCCFFLSFSPVYAQEKAFNVYSGGSLTVVLGNQFNNDYYQPTELLKQLKTFILKSLSKYDIKEKVDSQKIKESQKPFLEEMAALRRDLISSKYLIDSLRTAQKNANKTPDEDLEVSIDLIEQGSAIEKSSTVLFENNPVITVNQNNNKVYSFPKSVIDSNKNFISVYVSDRSKPTAIVQRFNRYGIISRSGNILIGFEYEYIENFEEDLAAAMQGGKYGFITRNNEIQIPFEYDFALSFRNGKALVTKNGKCFFINTNGKKVGKIRSLGGIVTSARYFNYDERICLHYNNNSEFLINKNGVYLWHLAPEKIGKGVLFDTRYFKKIIEVNSSGIYKVQFYDNTYGLTDNHLKLISKKYFFDFNFDVNNYAIVSGEIEKIPETKTNTKTTYKLQYTDDRYNVINLKGEEMLTKPYSFIDSFKLGFYRIKSDNGRWGLLSSTMQEKVRCEYVSLEAIDENIFLASKNAPLIKINGIVPSEFSYGVINQNGYSFIPIYFDKIELSENEIFTVFFGKNVSQLELIKNSKVPDVKCVSNCDEYNKFIYTKH